ncbi:hypothetical protein BH18ACI4_BH18ACI4_00590 [soil metagenome]
MVSQKTLFQLVLLIALTLGLGGLILRAQMPAEVGRGDWARSLPDGEGKGLVLGTCTQCHNLNSVVLQRKTARAWELSVRDMISRGAQIHVQEIAPISAYLARSFGPDASPVAMNSGLPAVSHPSLISESALNSIDIMPEGSAKALILRSCTSCHLLSKTTEARKDEAGWRGNVKDMIRLGAKLHPDEETAVITYLVKHFGRQAPATAISTSTGVPGSSSSMNQMARASTSANPAYLLPDGEGKALILATCVQCHASLGYVLGLRKDISGWRRTVDDMISRGAQVTEAEAEIINGYLNKHMAKE